MADRRVSGIPAAAIAALAMAAAWGGTLGAREARADFDPLYRGVRESFMGDAFTAVADDEETVYLNPAGCAGFTGASFAPLESMTEVSGDVISAYGDSKQLLSGGFSTDTLNALIGKNIYAREEYTPTFTMPNFGASVMIDEQAALLSQNATFPQITLGYQSTNGIQACYGTTIYKRVRKSSSTELRVGLGGKLLFRRGGYNDLTLTEALSDGKNLLADLAGNYQHGVGVDLGAQLLHKTGSWTFSAATAWTEIGNIDFGPTGQAAEQVGDLSVGAAVTYAINPLSSLMLAYDYRYLNLSADWRLKQHLGLEWKLPVVSFYAGLNEIYYSLGVIADFWLIRVSLGTYEDEIAAIAGVEPERRYVLGITMKLDL